MPIPLTPDLLARMRRACADRLGVALDAVVPAHGRVLIMHDPQRPGTRVFRRIGMEQPTCIVWEDDPPRVAWMRAANLIHIVSVA